MERLFSLSARSRLARHEIGAILKALRRMADCFAGEQPWVALRDDQQMLAHVGHYLLRDRDAVDLALLGRRGRFGPDHMIKVNCSNRAVRTLPIRAPVSMHMRMIYAAR